MKIVLNTDRHECAECGTVPYQWVWALVFCDGIVLCPECVTEANDTLAGCPDTAADQVSKDGQVDTRPTE